VTTRVKICGIRNPEMALIAAEAGADFIGLVFVPATPRQVSVAQAAQIVRALGSDGPRAVGLFLDATAEEMNAVAAAVGLNYIQLSGDEPPTLAAQLNRPLIKTLRCGGQAHIDELLAEVEIWHEAGATVLLDAPGAGGGHGKLADWDYATTVALRYPVVLAGGLSPANVNAAIEFVQPWGVDVSSGVERERGVKDATMIRDFIKVAKGVLPCRH
jgi:phosphoribosylanthranilate isomerase